MNQEFIEIGRQLAQRRREKGLNPEQLADVTKISLRFIEKMENGDFSFLPTVYVKAFLKVYATQVGLDPEVTIHQFESAMRAEAQEDKQQAQGNAPKRSKSDRETPGVEEEKIKYSKQKARQQLLQQKLADLQVLLRFYRPFVFGAVIIAALLAFLVISALRTGRNEQSESITEETIFSDTLTVANPVPQDTLLDAQLPPPPTKSSSDLKLTVYAKETTWVRIVFNDSLADEAVFAAGDVRSWQSKDNFYLKIGNAGGITLSLNGKVIGAAGAEGQVANLLIDRNGITRIPHSRFPAAMDGIVRP